MANRPYAKTAADNRLTVCAFVTILHQSIHGILSNSESHDFPELVYIERGTAPLNVGGQSITLTAGQMLIYASGTSHGGRGMIRAVMNNLGFETDTPLPDTLCNRAITLTDSQSQTLLQMIREGVPLFRHVSPDSDFSGMELCDGASAADVQRLKNRLELFLLDLTDADTKTYTKPTHPEEYLALCTWIDAHLGERLALKDIAAHGNISISKLKMLFHEQYGGGVTAFITERRIADAKEMIAAGRMNFTEIAEQLGFGTVHYFSRVFRRQTGVSPSEYRRALR